MTDLAQWLSAHAIERVDCMIPDLMGAARGKRLQSQALLQGSELRFPLVGLFQSVDGECRQDMIPESDPDMILQPDPSTLRLLPWASEPTAQLIHDAVDEQGVPLPQAPRNVLRRILERYRALGLQAIVAPEMEFYLTAPADGSGQLAAPSGREGCSEEQRSPYGIEAADQYEAFLDDLFRYCRVQDIGAAAMLHEVGRGQLEINLDHGDALALADQVFLFKRSAREAARRNGMLATFMAKPMADEAGSAMHIHQSLVYSASGKNAFSLPDGTPSPLFFHFIGGLQRYLPQAMLLIAPYPNSYRRLTPYSAAPINVEWGYDNRSCGLRVPHSPPQARRVENRLPGVDCNPYLAIAASLACGLLGIEQEIMPSTALTGSAYGQAATLPGSLDSAIRALLASAELGEILGQEFVHSYTRLKEIEYAAFNRIVTPREVKALLQQV